MEFQDAHTAVFVFAKDKKVKCLNTSQATSFEQEYLKATGWIHTQTLNPCLFIQSLVNASNKKEIHELLESLRNTDKEQNIKESNITPSLKEQLKIK
jgi:hypothetical protein